MDSNGDPTEQSILKWEFPTATSSHVWLTTQISLPSIFRSILPLVGPQPSTSTARTLRPPTQQSALHFAKQILACRVAAKLLRLTQRGRSRPLGFAMVKLWHRCPSV